MLVPQSQSYSDGSLRGHNSLLLSSNNRSWKVSIFKHSRALSFQAYMYIQVKYLPALDLMLLQNLESIEEV